MAKNFSQHKGYENMLLDSVPVAPGGQAHGDNSSDLSSLAKSKLGTRSSLALDT